MSNIKTRIFPVIHTGPNLKSNLNQIFTAYDAGVDGVFLIDHNLHFSSFSNLIDEMDKMGKKDFPSKKWPPDFAIGVNYLGTVSNEAANFFKPYMSMLWCDDNAIHLGTTKVSVFAEETIAVIRANGDRNSEFFGGIAFKHRRQPDYEELRCLISVACSIDGYIVTTSGSATGSAPTIEKIKMFREIMPADKRLAIASGASVDNVESFVDVGVTDILVSSSINTNDILDHEKLHKFVRRVKK